MPSKGIAKCARTLSPLTRCVSITQQVSCAVKAPTLGPAVSLARKRLTQMGILIPGLADSPGMRQDPALIEMEGLREECKDKSHALSPAEWRKVTGDTRDHPDVSQGTL